MKKLVLPTFSYWRTDLNTMIVRVQGGTQAHMKRTNKLIKEAGLPLEWRYDGLMPLINREKEEYYDIDLS